MSTPTLYPTPETVGSLQTVNFDVRGMSEAERDATRPARIQAFSAFLLSQADLFVDQPLTTPIEHLEPLSVQVVESMPSTSSDTLPIENDVIEGEFDDEPSTDSAPHAPLRSDEIRVQLHGTDLLDRKTHIIEATKPIDPLIRDVVYSSGSEAATYLRENPNALVRCRNVLSSKIKSALVATKEVISTILTNEIPVMRYARLGLAVVAGMNIATVLEDHVHLNEIKRPSVVAEAPENTIAIGPLPTEPAQLEVTPTSQVYDSELAIEDAIPTNEVEETPESTMPQPSAYEQYRSGTLDKLALEATKIGEVTIDSICMTGIDLYGDNRRSTNDKALLDYYKSAGTISAVEYEQLLAGTAPYELEARFQAQYDTIFKVGPVEVAQDETCVLPDIASEYPARFESMLKVPQSTSMEKLSDIEPVVDVNLGGALPGEEGIVVISGHRTTYSAPFKNLDRLVAGDEIKITTDDGKVYTYIVEGLRVVDVDDYDDQLLTPSASGSKYMLRMTTCEDRSLKRLVADAILAGTEA